MAELDISNFNNPYAKGGAVVISLLIAVGFYFFRANRANSYKKEARKFLVGEFEKWGENKKSQLTYLKPFNCNATTAQWLQYRLIKYKIDKIQVKWYSKHRRKTYSRTKYYINGFATFVVENPNGNEETYSMKYSLSPIGNGEWRVFRKE